MKCEIHNKKSYGKKHIGAEFPMCPRCTVVHLSLVQLRVSYFTSISFLFLGTINSLIINCNLLFVNVKHLRKYNLQIKQNTKNFTNQKLLNYGSVGTHAHCTCVNIALK